MIQTVLHVLFFSHLIFLGGIQILSEICVRYFLDNFQFEGNNLGQSVMNHFEIEK